MFLSVDVGNTQTTLGFLDNSGNFIQQWRMATDKTDTTDSLHARLYSYFMMYGLPLEAISDVAIASVVPQLSSEWVRMMRQVCATEPLLVDATRDCGIEVKLENPREVGADRLANAVAAKITYGAPVIVVDFGTATNIDVVDATGAFRGGAIIPGMHLSAQSLFSRASRLASVPLVVPPSPLGNSTETAVQSGIVIGAAAQAEGLVARIQAVLAQEAASAGSSDADSAEKNLYKPATVVGTGGNCAIVAAATTLFDALDPDLTTRGIWQIWQHRARKRALKEQTLD